MSQPEEPSSTAGSDAGPEPGSDLGSRALRARSFDAVADAYDAARPSYPPEAVTWLLGPRPRTVLELGAGTGKLTERLLALGHTVVATDPSEAMLSRLRLRAPRATVLAASAEELPLRAGSVDAVVVAQAFHWFDADRALAEIARVVRPGGAVGLLWNLRDERIPWVRRLGRVIGSAESERAPAPAIDATGSFEAVASSTYRFWQPVTRQSLRDLVLSRSNVAVLPEDEREQVLEQADELYDDYGRGRDGMLLPYVTSAYRTAVLPWAAGTPPRPPRRRPRRPPMPSPDLPGTRAPSSAPPPSDGLDSDRLLIDFH